MNGDENKSRFAELAMEMMGSQMAQKFLKEIWEEASESVKQNLADKVIEYDLDHFIKKHVGEMTEAILESDIKLRAKLIEELDQAAIALRDVLKKVYDELGRKRHDR